MRVLFAALFTVVAFAANAQLLPSALTGRVLAGDAPAAGVTVTATARARQQTRTATTSAQGTYWIDALEPGEYDVSFTRAGLTSLSRPAIVELGRIARADATLEASDDEETVTSTARTVSVAEWSTMTTHFTDEELDRMPVGRRLPRVGEVAPGSVNNFFALLEGATLYPSDLIGEEIIDEVTIFRGNLPIEAERHVGGILAARTRSGSDDFFLALRDSISSERWSSHELPFERDSSIEHFIETASGGRIGGAPLWFFAAGWSGDSADRLAEDVHGLELKLDSQLGAAHQLTVMHLDGESHVPQFAASTSITSLRYSGAISERFTAEAFASRAQSEVFAIRDRETLLTTRLSYVIPSSTGDHVLAGGASRYEQTNQWSLFLGDRWSAGRWFVDAGARYESGNAGDELTPRAAVTFDLRGNGRHALIASYGEYGIVTVPMNNVTIASLGYAIAIGSSGSARVDAVRSEHHSATVDQLQLDARYRLFDRLDLGANYTWSDIENRGFAPIAVEHLANVWAGIELPVGEHQFGATFLQRLVSDRGQDHAPSDIALRYSLPIRRTTFTVAADVLNAFDVEASSGGHPRRTARLWLRLRL